MSASGVGVGFLPRGCLPLSPLECVPLGSRGCLPLVWDTHTPRHTPCTPPRVNKMTGRCKNITFPKLRLRTVNITKIYTGDLIHNKNIYDISVGNPNLKVDTAQTKKPKQPVSGPSEWVRKKRLMLVPPPPTATKFPVIILSTVFLPT